MFLEKLFESIYGKIWLIILLVAMLALIVYLLVKNEKNEVKEIVEKVNNDSNEHEDNKEEVVQNDTETIEKEKEDKVIEENVPDYGEFVIIKGDDGFFRVKKKDSERTIRKFATIIESENYIEKRNLKND